MIPPKEGSSLSQDSTLNMLPKENCYIFGYESPNEISSDVPDMEHTVLSMVKF